MITEWVCTDPDREQYGRKIKNGVYEFKEQDTSLDEAYPREFIELTINLNQHSDKQIENHISAYYDSIEEIENIYGTDAEWIIAECIFEQESGLY